MFVVRCVAALAALASCGAPEPTDTSSPLTSSTTTPPTCPGTGTSSSVTVGGDPDHRLYVDHGGACLYGVDADEPFTVEVVVLTTCGGEILVSSCDVTVDGGVVTLHTTFEYVFEDLDSGVVCTPYPIGPTCEVPALPEGDYALCYGEGVLAFEVPGDDSWKCAQPSTQRR